MMMYCQHCGRALHGQTDFCPHCEKELDKLKDILVKEEEEQAAGRRSFKNWFTNVFWFHYKIHTWVVLFAVFIIALTAYSGMTKENPDFQFLLVSELPVSETQAEELIGFWLEEIEGAENIGHTVLYLDGISEYSAAGWSLLLISLIDDEYSLFIVGESVLRVFEENNILFYTTREMGLAAGPLPELVPLSGVGMMDELQFAFEPMYALVKRPAYNKKGSVPPENIERSALSVECLKALLGT